MRGGFLKRAPGPIRPAERLILHIGTPKTGSTAIQSLCAANRGALRAEGALYPLSLGRTAHQPFAAAMGRLFARDGLRAAQGVSGPRGVLRLRRDLAAALTREIDETRPRTLIISSENLFTDVRAVPDARRIRRFLAPFAERIEVLAYLRRQDRAMFSAWAHAMRLGKSADFVAPVIMVRGGRYDYAARMSLWARAFGRDAVSAVPFDRVGGDIAADFLLRAGVTGLKSGGERANRSLNDVKAGFMSAMGAHLPRLDGSGLNAARGDLSHAIDAVGLDRSALRISPRDAQAILTAHAASNARLSREFGDGAPFFDEAVDEGNDANVSLTVSDVIEISAQLWARGYADRMRLRDMARAAGAQPRRNGVVAVHGASHDPRQLSF